MAELRNEFKQALGIKWVRSDSGTTYLCPVDAFRGLDNPTEQQLKTLCVDESINPHNE